MDKIYLVDGSGYIFRAFYAVQSLRNREGFPTNALFGYTRMLLKLLREAESKNVAVIFDSGRVSFRTELFAGYKSHRKETPEDLVLQFPFFREISAAIGLPILELANYEADDVIGTLAKRLAGRGTEVIIVTGDKDLMQLVGKNISIWDTMKDVHYRDQEVVAKMGVPPEKIVDLLGLTGDTSDNIPGLSGVGPKTAVQLLNKYGSVEGVIAGVREIRADSSIRNRTKIADQIEHDTELLRLSRRLAEIDCNAPVEIVIDGAAKVIDTLPDAELLHALTRRPPHRTTLESLVERFEFSTLFDGLEIPEGPPTKAKAEAVSADYKTIYAEEFPAWLEELCRQKEFAFDLETTSLDVHEAQIVGASFCWEDARAYYVPIGHVVTDDAGAVDSADEVSVRGTQIDCGTFLERCRGIFGDPTVLKYGQNLKYDISVLACRGVPTKGISFDTMIASYLLAPDLRNHNLSVLAKDCLGRTLIEFDEVLDGRESFALVPIPDATRYGCQDAHVAWRLKSILAERIEAEKLGRVFDEIEMPLVPILGAMERKGVLLDSALLARMSDEFAQDLQVIRGKIFEAAGCEFNMNSTKQLAEVLFEKLQISTKGLKKTKTGISTDSSVLEKLADLHPLPGLILHHRTIHKLKSTYVDALPAQVSRITGRLHSRFNQSGTGTGRISSSDPNLQNIPIQTPEGRRIRNAFIAPPGRMLISADYSQIELRLLAHLSGDENMIESFRNDVDIHARTARELLGIAPEDEVPPEMRRIGKTINFGIVYGMSGFRLGRDLGIPVSTANSYIERYFENYPRVRVLFQKLENDAEQLGYVTTLFGRKRVLTDIDSTGRDRGFLTRAAINAPLQGSAADIIKIAMIRLADKIEKSGAPLDMILQIHDELVFECDTPFVTLAVDMIRSEMESAATLVVPLRVDVGVGHDWQEAHS